MYNNIKLMVKNINNQDTKEILLKAAREEFFEKGYEKASLRNMCNKAGLTTGALYFFFKDKRDIFNHIIAPLLEEIQTTLVAHYAYEQEMADSAIEIPDTVDTSDIEVSENILKIMYKYHDECVLFLSTSDVSSDFINRVIQYSEGHYTAMFEKLSGTSDFDHYIMHWISHLQIDAFVHLFLHEENEEKALAKIPSIISFIVHGFYSYLEEVKNRVE